MGVIAEFVTPASTFAAGRALERREDQWVELERLVPTDEEMIPFIWVWGGDHDAYEERLESEPGVELDGPIAETGTGALYRVHWRNAMSEVIGGLFDHEFTLLSGKATTDGWRFEVRFPDSAAASAFQTYLTENDIPHDLTRVHGLTNLLRSDTEGLTDGQREALVVAHQGGYFEQPRRMTTDELAEALDVAPSSASGRLRRGLHRLVDHTLIAERALAGRREERPPQGRQ